MRACIASLIVLTIDTCDIYNFIENNEKDKVGTKPTCDPAESSSARCSSIVKTRLFAGLPGDGEGVAFGDDAEPGKRKIHQRKQN